ncbi:MAG: hypothetical protein HDR88_06430 [Bacteroides sp.]|nr:hypothetical protein [Bacteroides sp.]
MKITVIIIKIWTILAFICLMTYICSVGHVAVASIVVSAEDMVANNYNAIGELNYADSLMNKFRKHIGNKADMFYLIDMFEKYGLNKKVYEVCNIILDSQFKLDDYEFCKVLYGVCRGAYVLGDFYQAFKNSEALLNHDKADSLEYFNVEARIISAKVMIQYGLYDKVSNIINDGFTELERVRNVIPIDTYYSLKSQLYITRALMFLNQRKLQEALVEISKSVAIPKKDVVALNAFQIEKAEILSKTGKGEEAEAILTTILSYPLPHYNSGVALSDYMLLLISAKRYEEAIDIYNNLGYLEKFIYDDTAYARLYESLSEAYMNIGEPDLAFIKLSNSKNRADSIVANDNSLLVNSFVGRLGRSQRSDFFEEDEFSSVSRSKINLIIILSGLLILGIIALVVLFYRLYGQKLQTVKTIEKLENYEAIRQKKEQTSQNTIEDQQQELSILSLQLAHINEKMTKALTDLNSDHISDADKLINLRSTLSSIDIDKGIWDLFSIHFNRINKSFFETLLTEHPNLTKGELRLCALIWMNLSTKEIAMVTNRSVRTVESMKYRLHKKLNISESTESYLRKFQTDSEN